jgi:hypothetical protein
MTHETLPQTQIKTPESQYIVESVSTSHIQEQVHNPKNGYIETKSKLSEIFSVAFFDGIDSKQVSGNNSAVIAIKYLQLLRNPFYISPIYHNTDSKYDSQTGKFQTLTSMSQAPGKIFTNGSEGPDIRINEIQGFINILDFLKANRDLHFDPIMFEQHLRINSKIISNFLQQTGNKENSHSVNIFKNTIGQYCKDPFTFDIFQILNSTFNSKNHPGIILYINDFVKGLNSTLMGFNSGYIYEKTTN